MKQITNVNDLQEGDVMELGGRSFEYLPRKHATRRLFVCCPDPSWYQEFNFTPEQVQDLMDHGIPFRRKVAEGEK